MKSRYLIDSEEIISIIGVRHSGKTSILYSIIKTLRKRVEPSDIIYLYFEDNLLFLLELQNLNAIS